MADLKIVFVAVAATLLMCQVSINNCFFYKNIFKLEVMVLAEMDFVEEL